MTQAVTALATREDTAESATQPAPSCPLADCSENDELGAIISEIIDHDDNLKVLTRACIIAIARFERSMVSDAFRQSNIALANDLVTLIAELEDEVISYAGSLHQSAKHYTDYE